MADLVPPVYETDPGLRALANYLRSGNGVKIRSAIEHDKRVEYFKGNYFLLIFSLFTNIDREAIG